MNSQMSDTTRSFIRALGEHNEMKIVSTEGVNHFALGFYSQAHADGFSRQLNQLYLMNVDNEEFGERPLDEVCREFIHRIYLGVPDAMNFYQEEKQVGSETVPSIIWYIFEVQEQLYLVAGLFFKLWDEYTNSWAFDYEEGI